MKRKNKLRQIISIFILSLSLTISSTASAVEKKETSKDSLENITDTEREEFALSLTQSILSNNTDFMQANTDKFTTDVYSKLTTYIERNTLGEPAIINSCYDYITPNNSSTGDSVIMENVKIGYDDYKYNKVFLFEYHVNSNGDIYGYNIWQY